MKVTMKNNSNGKVKVVPTGYSWMTLCFGCLPALFRADFIGTLFILIVNLIVLFATGSIIIEAVFDAVIAGFYNKNYLERLVRDGWSPMDEESSKILKSL